MKFLRFAKAIIVCLPLLATISCESHYEAPNRFAVLFGPQWRRYVNSRREVALAFLGQSNAAGIGDSSLSPILPDSTAYEWVFQQNGANSGTGYLKPLRDPMSAHRPFAYQTKTGSLIPACVLRYKELTGLKPVVSLVAAGGTWLLPCASAGGGGGWEPGGYLREGFLVQTRHMLELNGFERLAWITVTMGETDGVNSGRYPSEVALFPDGMIVPGSFDAANGYPTGYPNPTNIPNLYSGYSQLIEELRTNFPEVKININQTGTWYRDEPAIPKGVMQMWLVQEHLARTIPNVYCEMKDAKYFEAFGYMQADHVHYNQAGLNYMGRVDGQIMATH